MEKDIIIGKKMDMNIKVIILMELLKAKVYINMEIKLFIKENLKMELKKELVN